MRVTVLTLLAATMGSISAAAETLPHDFLDLVENTCLPAIENAVVPDLSSLEPYDADDPAHNPLGPGIGEGFVTDDPRLLVAYGERNGFRGCEVSFAAQDLTEEGAAIVDRLEDWIADHIDRTPYELVDNCVMPGFRFFVVAGSEDRNPRGNFIRVLAYGGVDPNDDQRYGQPRVVVGETPDASEQQCIENGPLSG